MVYKLCILGSSMDFFQQDKKRFVFQFLLPPCFRHCFFTFVFLFFSPRLPFIPQGYIWQKSLSIFLRSTFSWPQRRRQRPPPRNSPSIRTLAAVPNRFPVWTSLTLKNKHGFGNRISGARYLIRGVRERSPCHLSPPANRAAAPWRSKGPRSAAPGSLKGPDGVVPFPPAHKRTGRPFRNWDKVSPPPCRVELLFYGRCAAQYFKAAGRKK